MATLIIQRKGLKLPLLQNMRELSETIQLWVDRAQQRKQLARLDADILEDLGLNHDMIAREVAKPFWK